MKLVILQVVLPQCLMECNQMNTQFMDWWWCNCTETCRSCFNV